ncbi:unnamed protein product [Camellia sinensis]
MVLLDTNPFFWSTSKSTSVLAFLNSVLLLNQFNQVVVIATGFNTCDYVYDSSSSPTNQRAETLLRKFEEFVVKDEQLSKEDSVHGIGNSLLSGSLSMALCCILRVTPMVKAKMAKKRERLFSYLCHSYDIQRVFRSGSLHPQPRVGRENLALVKTTGVGSTNNSPKGCFILCLHGSPDGPGQYVAVMNAIFSAQRSMTQGTDRFLCVRGTAFCFPSAGFLHNWGCVSQAPTTRWAFSVSLVFGTDLHSRRFLQLPKPVGVDFRASGAFVTKTQLTWATYALFVCLYFVSITRNVQPVGVSFWSGSNKCSFNVKSEEKDCRYIVLPS